MQDQSLSGRLAVDLDAHFEELVRTFQDRLYGFALRLMRSPQDAEEATQDTFVRAYRALAGYSAERLAALRLRPWLYQIALNVVRNRVRRHAVGVEPLDNGYASHVSREQPESAALMREDLSHLARAILALPERYATAVVLRHVQGLSYAEAAEVLEQPVGTTKSDVHRGLRLLREALEPELFVMGEHSR